MKTIPLTQGQVALVDDSDFAGLSAHKWHALRTKNGGFYAVRNGPCPRRGLIYLHRSLLPEGSRGDHINRDTRDNQRHNLRPATSAQNNANVGLRRSSTSGFKGVSWNAKQGKWFARVQCKGRSFFLGRFHSAVAAALAYDAEAAKRFGEFACVNFPRKTSK
jgi:hypothetical protein